MHPIASLIDSLEKSCAGDGVRSDDRVRFLSICLDKLTAAAQEVVFEFDDTDYAEMESNVSSGLRDKVAEVFPDFGAYNSPFDLATNIGTTELCVGSALDDFVEILEDLREIIWRFENTSEADALFHFSFGYRTHWGRHARDLQLYIIDSNL